MKRSAGSAEVELVKMSELSRRSGVPSATIKHYLREGLLPEPVKRTGRNMAWYDAGQVERIRAIKKLQREHFLPLRVIKDVLDGAEDHVDEATTAAAIARVLQRGAPKEGRSRRELVTSGVVEADLDWMKQLSLVTPSGKGDEERYFGDDLALLRVLGASRKAGLRPEMLPTGILADYADAIRRLVRTELQLFRKGVLPRAGDDLPGLAEAATALSEQLVVLIRRKMLLPTLEQMVEEANGGERSKAKPKKR